MSIEVRIRRLGYHLMSLASVGMALVAIPGLFLTALPWMPKPPHSQLWSIFGITGAQASAFSADARLLLALSCLAGMLAYLLPLAALRRLGHRLYRDDALTRPVADAFGWLAHSLPLHAVCMLAAWLLAGFGSEIAGVPNDYRMSVDLGAAYIFLIGCLCLYSVAHLMRLATAAADDARSIV